MAADAHAPMPGIGGDGAQGLGHGLEQDAEDDPAVAEADGGDLRWQGEDHVEVGHRQELGDARLAPALGGHPLASRAVAVATGVVERMLAPAAVTGVDVPAEQSGAARLDGAHDLEPDGVDAPFAALTESGAGAAEDLRHAGAFGLHALSDAQRCEA